MMARSMTSYEGESGRCRVGGRLVGGWKCIAFEFLFSSSFSSHVEVVVVSSAVFVRASRRPFETVLADHPEFSQTPVIVRRFPFSSRKKVNESFPSTPLCALLSCHLPLLVVLPLRHRRRGSEPDLLRTSRSSLALLPSPVSSPVTSPTAC
jgi:hypothetical protein